MSEQHTYTVKVVVDDDGSYFAEVKDLPGCFASGDTLEEALEHLTESISLVLSSDDEVVVLTSVQATRVLGLIEGEGRDAVTTEVEYCIAR